MNEFASTLSQLSPTKRKLLQKLLQEKLASESVDLLQSISERPAQETMVCSFSQEQIWLLDQLDPGNISYNISFANRLKGRLDLASLERSLQEVIARHEVLRTTFVNIEGQPQPVLVNCMRLVVPLVDLQQIPEEEQENRVKQLLQSEARQPFDLARGPLLRVLLLRLDACEHVLLLVMHHIISDGWSMRVLAQELTVLYNAFTSKTPSSLPALTLQYADFARWQRGYLQGKMLDAQLTYWRRQLSGVVPLELPTDHPRPAHQTFNGAHQLVSLPQSLYDGLRGLSRKEGVTLFMVLLAALQTWLYRYTGQTDIAVGTPIANRTHPGVEGLIGFFLNTLVIRTDLSGNPRFTELLKRVSNVTQEAFAHQDIPFAKLVAELQPRRSLSHAPFFQVVFILQDTSMVDLRLELLNLTQSLFPVESGTSQADLTLQMLETEQHLAVYVEYNTDLFEATTIARMLDHWQRLLVGVVTAPEQTIAALPLLSEAEQQTLLLDWNGPIQPLPQGLSVHQAIEAQVERTPDRLAVCYGEQALTYQALNQYANHLAIQLLKQGLTSETLVAILAERSLPFLVALLAIWKAGGAFLPLDPLHPASRLQQVIGQSGTSLVLTTPAFQPVLAQILQQGQEPQVLVLDSLLAQVPQSLLSNPCLPCSPKQLAYVIYTSGSTGIPKGVMVEQAGMFNHILGKIADTDLSAGDCVAQNGPQSFDIFFWQAVAAFLLGGRVEVISDEAAFHPMHLLRQVEERAISHLQVVPALLRGIVQEVSKAIQARQKRPDLQTLRWLIPTGDALPSELCASWFAYYPHIPILNTYGSTECSDDQCHYPLTVQSFETTHQSLPIVPIGLPIANMRGYVIDSTLHLFPMGSVGELAIAGVGVGRGYLGDPERTAQVFLPDPYASEPGTRIYLTKDRVRRLPDGNLEFLGRTDALVKVRGYRIELGEIEATLQQHPDVQESVVIVSEVVGQGKEIIAYVVGRERANIQLEELRTYLREKLPDYMVPSGWMQLEKLPLNANGKVDRKALPTPQPSAISERKAESLTHTPVEDLLLDIWKEVLKCSEIGIHDNFFSLGGHSLAATQLISRIRALVQVEIPLRSVFEAPTIAELAQQVELRWRHMQGVMVPLPLEAGPRPAEIPLSFAQQRLWFLEQLEPGNIAYNISGGIRLTGQVSEAVLEQSLKEIVQRHESLRTTFKEKDHQVVQVIKERPEFELMRVDLSGLLQEKREKALEHLIQQEARHPFDLERGPLLRAMLLRWGSQEYQLQVSLHHIIADGWSIEVLIRELTALYPAFAEGKPSPLASLTLQYPDFALWQRRWLQGEVLEKQLAYWRAQLDQVPALELPTDYPRPAMLISEGDSRVVHLSRSLQQQLQALCQREGATLFMVLLAAFQVLLSRYCGQNDIAVGTPIANRTRSEIEGLIGFFVNALVIRTDLSGNPAFTELLRRVREVTLGAYAHQDLPFEKLVEVLQPERDLSRSPLFQVMFILQNVPRETHALPELQISRHRVEHRTAKFDLTLEITPDTTGLRCEVEYNRALFKPARMEQFLAHWQMLLQSIVAQPECALADLPLLTEQERERLLVTWNATQTSEPVETNLSQLLTQQVARTPDAVAAVYEEQLLTYAYLDARASTLACHLQSLGVGPEVLVGVCMERSLDLVVSLVAILKAGGAYVPLDPSYPQERLAYMLQDAQVPVVLTQSAWRDRCLINDAIILRCLDSDWQTIGSTSATPLNHMVQPEHLAYMIYTSGSTGRPKGAMNTHMGICNRLLWMQKQYQLTSADRVLQKTPYSFDVSVWEFFWPLLAGASLVLAVPGGHQDPTYLKTVISEQAITTLHFVPAMLQIFLQEPQLEQCDSVRQVICSGEELSVELQRRFFASALQGAGLHNLYGPTEAAIDVSFWECQPNGEHGTVPIGHPISNIALYVLDSWLHPVPVGVVGELYIAGMGLARGYHRRADLTAEKFLPHPFVRTSHAEAGSYSTSEAGERIYKTGDLARYRTDGAIEYVGRIDNQIKVRGFRIELGEIESVLQTHPAVQESVVVVRERASNDKQLVAYLVPVSNARQIGDATKPWEEEHVEQWQMLYNDLYQSCGEMEDRTLNIVGWNSSYTGQPLTADEMREQIEQAVSRILIRAPQRLMEIGCGTGMLLFRLAPYTKAYIASDFSKDALHYVEQILATQALPQVRLSQQAAHEAVCASEETFDAIIFNSVVQYFPGMLYLRQVLTQALAALEAGGFLFVGDVRNLVLHRAYSTSVEFYKAPPSLSRDELRQRIQQKLLEEEELLVDPAFFHLLQRSLPQIGQVQVLLKRGKTLNELTRFRYDVLIRKEATEATKPVILSWKWGQEVESLSQVQTYLQAQVPENLHIQHIPNRRVEEDLQVVNWVFGEHGQEAETVGTFREELRRRSLCGLDPEDVWELGERWGYQVDIFWSEAENGGVFDVSFQKGLGVQTCYQESGTSLVQEVFPDHLWLKYVNNPLQGKITRWVLPQLRDFLKERLPDYMIPAHFMALEHLPLTANGKIDRKVLPAPEEHLLNRQQRRFVAPQTPVEESLVAIWAELLLRSQVSVTDNFFELGGHSLLATQVVARVRQTMGVELPLRTIFETPTIAELAQRIEAAQQDNPSYQIPSIGTMERPEYIPLAFAQQRLWFLDQFEPGGTAYLISGRWQLEGILTVQALERSLLALIERHESLRTTFQVYGEHPVQVIHPQLALRLPLIDLSSLPPSEQERQTHTLMQHEIGVPFDLAHGPLLRCHLLRCASRRHLLLLSLHHIIADGWSELVLMRELGALYQAYLAGAPAPLPALPIQYADFALWQRSWLQGERLDAHLDYWRTQLAQVPVLELPTDFPRSPVQTFEGASQQLILPLSLSEQLHALAQREGVTLFMLLLAAFQILLARYSGQDDMAVGTPIANRTHSELEDLIGFFVNTLVIRTDLSGRPTFRQVLQRVREATLGAYAHQDLPFEKLVEVLHPHRDLSRSPLFQVMFILQNTPKASQSLPGLTISELHMPQRTAKFDLTLEVTPTATGLNCVLEYNCRLFARARSEQLLTHWQVLLDGLVAHPEWSLEQLPLLSAEQQEQVLVAWNNTQVPAYREGNLLHRLERQVQLTPDAVAVVYEEQCLTYRHLHQQANQLAHYLQQLGVGPEQVVGVALPRSLWLTVALLGILKAGGAYVPLDPAYPAARLSFMLEDSQVMVLLTQSSLLAALPEGQALTICLDADWKNITAQASDRPLCAISPAHLLYIIYTSGSTGWPKGVSMTHGVLWNLLSWQLQDTKLTQGPRTLQFASLSFDVSFQEIFATWCCGGALVLLTEEVRRDPIQLWQVVINEAITTMFLPFIALHQLAEVADDSQCIPSHLSTLITAGEQLQMSPAIRHLLSRLEDCTLHNQYGPTESHVVTAFTLTGLSQDWPSLPSIGRPIANAQIYLLDSQLHPVLPGAIGELFIGGIGLSRGYRNRPQLTAERFIPHPFSCEPGQRLYRTGDLARYLPDGTIMFVGRRDTQVKVRGFRIELEEIETVLAEHPLIREAVVVEQQNASTEKRLVAYLVPASSPAVMELPSFPDALATTEGGSDGMPQSMYTVSQLRQYLMQKLPDYMLPAAYVLIDELPLTPSGKIDRRSLSSVKGIQIGLEAAYVAPRTELERIMASIWQDLLQREQIGVEENFFELGGHSLLATRLNARLQLRLEIELPLRTIFEAPTIAGLAQRIAAMRQSDLSRQFAPLTPTRRPELIPLSFAQQRLWFLEQLEPGNVAYNLSAGIRLQGQMKEVALERSLREVVRRHESLRTTFVERDQQVGQVIEQEQEFRLLRSDLSGLPQQQLELELRRLMRQEAEKPFNLKQGPLFRAILLRCGTQEHLLLLSMHHIVADGWSVEVLVRELTELYSAFANGKPSPLPPLPFQYADFALWQRNWLQGAVLERHLAYWRAHLQGASPLQLPTDYPRPLLQSFQGASQVLHIPISLQQRLQELSQQENATLFMTLLAAFQVLLSRYSDQQDISVGTPIANRTHSELENLIGFFVNTLVMRSDLSGNPSFWETLSRVREVALGAYAHQDVPFEKLVEVLEPERDLSRSPLFQVMFILQNTPKASQSLPGLTISELSTPRHTAKFDLTLEVTPTATGLNCVLEYNCRLFTPARIAQLLTHWQVLLDGIVTHPEWSLGQLPLLSAEQQEQLLVTWNATPMPYPASLCLPELFEIQAKWTPDAIAILDQQQHLTYHQLNIQANRLAHVLRRSGVSLESRVGICLERSCDLVIAILAVLKAGGTYLPLDADTPIDRLCFILTDSQAALLLTHSGLSSAAAGTFVCKTLLLDQLADHWQQEDGSNLQLALDSEQAAYLIYTSGSTGRPKGVLGLHRGMINRVYWMWLHFPFTAGERSCQKTAINFVDAIAELFVPLLSGVPTAIVSQEQGRDPDLLISAMACWGVSRLVLVPSLLRSLLQASPDLAAQLPQLSLWICSGETLPLELVQRFKQALPTARLLNLYGSSEVSADATACDVMTADAQTAIPIGRPLANTQVYVLDRYGQPVPVGAVGEVYVGGAGLARGYVGQVELTAERFVPNAWAKEPGARLYRTGDLARWNTDGWLEYKGRNDRQVKVRGVRVELGELEALLMQHPLVRAAVVAKHEMAGGDTRLVAYVVPVVRQEADILEMSQENVPAESWSSLERDLRKYLQASLPEYMLPSFFMILEALPLTASGKVDWQNLPSPTLKTLPALERRVAPRTPLEEVLVAQWQEVLGLSPVGCEDNFFELGGHSLLATQVISRVRTAIQAELPLRSLFEAPTIAGLAERIERALRHDQEEAVPPLLPAQRVGPVPLSFAQQRLWFLSRLEPESGAYLIPSALRIWGSLDIVALEQSLKALVQRHESLRTTFAVQAGEPCQIINSVGTMSLPVVDISGLDEQTREREVLRMAEQEAHYPCNLTCGPLLRTSLLRLSMQEHVFLLTMHHIISDGWSNRIFYRELTLLYQAFTTGQPFPLAPLYIQYADFALYQRQWLQGELLERQLRYWKNQLGSPLPVLDFPLDHPRSPLQTSRGATRSLKLPASLLYDLRALGQREGATLFMTLLAAFYVLLHYYTRQDDLLVGTDVANRNRIETESLIGFFVNQLVLRTNLIGNPSFREMISRVRKVALEAYAYQDLPFDRLVEALNPQRDLSRTPLFQVKFVLQNAPIQEVTLSTITVKPVEFERGTSKFDLLLNMSEDDHELFGWLEYRTDLFNVETMIRFLQHFEMILKQVVAFPDARLDEINAVLASADREERNVREQERHQINLQRLGQARRRTRHSISQKEDIS